MRQLTDPVIVGVDGSPISMRALDLAADEAVLHDVPLRVIHVAERGDVRRRADGRRPPTAVSPRRVLAVAYEAAECRHAGLKIETVAVDGLPAVVLIGESAGASLTVVGHRGRGGHLGLAAGAVCTQVAARGHGPILITRGAAPLRFDAPIVLGVDADAPASAAIEFAFAEADLRGVPVRVVYAWSTVGAIGEFEPTYYDFDEARQEAARMLAEAVAGWSESYPDVKTELTVEHSLDPPAAMLRASSEASLVVVGPHDHDPWRRLLLGSVDATLTHHARCPVAVAHAAG